MTDREKRRFTEFIRAKVLCIGKYTDAQYLEQLKWFTERLLGHLESKPVETVKRSSFKNIDHELELMAREALGKNEIDAVSEEMKSKFGFGRIAEDPDKVIKKVIKRGKIESDDEFQTIRDIMSSSSYDQIDEASREALTRLFRKYEGLN